MPDHWTAIYLAFQWSGMTITQVYSFIVAIVIVLHRCEEEHIPGGFGYMFNVIVFNSDLPDRYRHFTGLYWWNLYLFSGEE